MAQDHTVIRIEGLGRLARASKRVSDTFPKELKEIHAKVVAPAVSTAKQLVRKLSGKLADSIKPSATGRAARVQAGRKAVPYAGVQHYGWPEHNIKPNMYLTEALHREENAGMRIYEVEMAAFLDKVWAATTET